MLLRDGAFEAFVPLASAGAFALGTDGLLAGKAFMGLFDRTGKDGVRRDVATVSSALE